MDRGGTERRDWEALSAAGMLTAQDEGTNARVHVDVRPPVWSEDSDRSAGRAGRWVESGVSMQGDSNVGDTSGLADGACFRCVDCFRAERGLLRCTRRGQFFNKEQPAAPETRLACCRLPGENSALSRITAGLWAACQQAVSPEAPGLRELLTQPRATFWSDDVTRSYTARVQAHVNMQQRRL